MTNSNMKVIRVKGYEKEDYERDQQKRVKRTISIGVDFHKIEDSAVSDFEMEIQKKIAVVPDPSRRLLREEQREILQDALTKVKLSRVQRICIELTLEGLRPIEVANELEVRDTTVFMHLNRAILKIGKFLRQNKDF